MTRHRIVLPNRLASHTSTVRCVGYAICSELLASPHDVTIPTIVQERASIAQQLPYAMSLEQIRQSILNIGIEQLRDQYSSLFEVGDEGPPVPIREDLQSGRRAGIKEEVVRFYDYFGYVLDERFAWQPDHLSVELEFMHYLCYREAEAADGDRLPFQLAQADFTKRHLVTWLPQLSTNVANRAPESVYAGIVDGIRCFVLEDDQWQTGTIIEAVADDGAAMPSARS